MTTSSSERHMHSLTCLKLLSCACSHLPAASWPQIVTIWIIIQKNMMLSKTEMKVISGAVSIIIYTYWEET